MCTNALLCRTNLARFGISTRVIDNSPRPTAVGKADGLQPKTIETWKQMRIGDELLNKGKKIYDMAYWVSHQHQALLDMNAHL